MRIAQVAPLAESVPPKLYGGTERVVAWLIDELVELGHEVTLFASGDSATRAKLVAACPRALRLARPRADPIAAQATLLETVARHARDFDVIHCHIDWLHLPLLSRLGVPFVTTAHGRLDLPGLHEVVCRFPGAPFVSISDNQRKPLGEANWLGTVYHGLPAESLRPVSKSGSYLAFLGRLSKEKGPEVAMRIARAAGMPLRIAAKLPREERGYFKEHLEPQIDGDQVQLVGEVKDDAKQKFLGEAAALLFPIDWPEPFGLVMIEAMACGTPVIAFRRGSVPEIVDEGVTGFVVDEEPGAIRAIARLGELDRHRVRARFEQRFTAKRMAREYLRHYEALTAAAQPKSPPSDIATLVSGNLQACRLFASARGGSVSSPRSGSIPALRADVAAPIADADRSAPRLAGVGASFQRGCCVPQRWRFNPLGLAIRCIRVAVKAALRPLANTRSNKRHNGAAAQLRSFMFVEFVQRKRRPKWQETTGGMRNGSIAMTIGGDAQASALKVPAVIVMAEAQHGSMAATIAIMVLPMDKVEKTGVPARNPAAVVGTTEAAAIMDGAATGVLVPALRRESTDSAMRATGTIDRAMMIDSARTEIMAPITAAAEEPAATAETMAGTVAGQSTGMPAAGANGITTAAVGRARTTAAVRARSAAFGIERQMKFRPGSVMKKLCGAGSRTSGVAGRATIPAPAIASAKM